MTMMSKTPFEGDELSRYRMALHNAGRRIDRILDRSGVTGEDAAACKRAAYDIIRSGTPRNAEGRDILDKVTVGERPTWLERMTGNGHRYDEKNLRNKDTLAAYLADAEGFDARSLINGVPQSDDFRDIHAHRLAVFDEVLWTIDDLFAEAAWDEEFFFEKSAIFREFESDELGVERRQQPVSDPFAAGDAVDAALDTRIEPTS